MAIRCSLLDVKVVRYILDILSLIFIVLYSTLKSLCAWIIPVENKCIRNEVILITGGGKGLGKRLAIEFARRQPRHIILWGKEEEAIEEVADLLKRNGVASTAMLCDVSDRECIDKKAREVQESVGSVTILVNNAGVVYGLPIIESKDCEIEDALNVNALAHIWTVKAFLPAMLESNRGHIVSINSVLGLVGLNGAADYCASKFAATGVMESLHRELMHDLRRTGVKVTTVHPYKIKNNMFRGCHTRFPLLFPDLDESYVAERTVLAVLTNRERLLLPWIMNLVWWANSWLPMKANMAIMRLTGVNRTMESFYRRFDGDVDQKG